MLPWLANFAPEPGLKAILFDIDNTLVDRDGAFEACLHQEISNGAARRRLRQLDQGGQGCRQALFRSWSHETGRTMNQRKFVQLLSEQLSPDPEQKRRLKQLSTEFKLAIVSNGGKTSQWRKLEATELIEIFDPENIFVSSELGMEKPDPRIFHLACQGLGEKPRDCLFIGDRDEIDGLGARRAGLHYLGCSPL